jgi:hypothetical protein
MSKNLNNKKSVNDLTNLLDQAVKVRDWERYNHVLKSVADKQEKERLSHEELRNKKFQAMKVGQLVWENDIETPCCGGADFAWKIVDNVPSDKTYFGVIEYKNSIEVKLEFIVNDNAEHVKEWCGFAAGDPSYFDFDRLEMHTSKLNKIYWKYVREG